jgi:hypothetical protein
MLNLCLSFFRATLFLFIVSTTCQAMQIAPNGRIAGFVDFPFFDRGDSRVEKVDDGLFIVDLQADLFGVMERVTNENSQIWYEFSMRQQERRVERLKAEIERDKWETHWLWHTLDPMGKWGYVNPGVKAWNEGEIWVAYLTNSRPRRRFDIKNFKNIEMAVLVMHHPGIKIQVHLGIFRCPAFGGRVHHPRISGKLHALGATIMGLRPVDQRPTVMMTVPAEKMGDLIKAGLPKTAVSIGKNQPEGLVQQAGKYNSQDPFSLTVKDFKGNLVLEAKSREALSELALIRGLAHLEATYCGGKRCEYHLVDLKPLGSLLFK